MSQPTLPNVKRILSAARTYKAYARRSRMLRTRAESEGPLIDGAKLFHAQRQCDLAKVRLLHYIETGDNCPPHLAAKRKPK